MKKTNFCNQFGLTFTLLLFLATISSYGQEEHQTPPENPETIVNADPRLKEVLKIKSNMNLNERYKIQLYYGNLSGANGVLGRYRRDYARWSSSIEYETPNHKVWVGNFRNRLEADRALVDIQRKFPNAFVFKPDRK